MRSPFRLLLAPLLLLGSAVPMRATNRATTQPRYTVTDLGTLGGPESEANAVNDAGVIVGSADIVGTDEGGKQISHAYRWRDGEISDLEPAVAGSSTALGISNVGVAAGMTPAGPRLWLNDGSGVTLPTAVGASSSVGGAAYGVNSHGQACGTVTGLVHAPVVWHAARALPWPSLRHQVGVVRAINERGVAVGWDDGTESPVAIRWSAQALMVLHPHKHRLRDNYSDWANAINARGDIVGGLYSDRIGARGFRWRNGLSTTLAPPSGFDSSEAVALNDSGHVVGSAWHQSSPRARAVLWRDGAALDLNTLLKSAGWILSQATGINNRGEIVGTGLHNGVRRGFLLTPQ